MADGLIVVVLAISTGAVALGQGIPPNRAVSSEAWGSYRSERGHFSLEHPAGWSAVETGLDAASCGASQSFSASQKSPQCVCGAAD